jgi:ribosomal-protein-serine acetyltransferase
MPRGMWLRTAPPARIVGAQLTLRRWETDDAVDLCTAVTDSIEPLRKWMPWAADYDLTAARRFLGLAQSLWQVRDGFDYGIVDATGRILGSVSMHADISDGGLQIGYWIRTGATRRHVATRAAALVTAEAFRLDGVTHTEIHHDRANEISGRIPRRLGYEHVATVSSERLAPGHTGVELQWRMTAEAYATSMARTLVAG